MSLNKNYCYHGEGAHCILCAKSYTIYQFFCLNNSIFAILSPALVFLLGFSVVMEVMVLPFLFVTIRNYHILFLYYFYSASNKVKLVESGCLDIILPLLSTSPFVQFKVLGTVRMLLMGQGKFFIQ